MNARCILIIDDEEPILAVVRGCLEDLAGWRVLSADSGTEGLRLAAAERPDGILLDLSLPSMDGDEILKYLRGDPRTAGIPVILLTARSPAGDRTKFSEMGVAGSIYKPFNPATLSDEIAALLKWQ
ncbi:MAG: response regulator [Limnospira sp.]